MPVNRVLIRDLEPPHKDATTGVHGVGASTVDSFANRDAAISTHKADASAHHTKYTDAEAQATVKANVEVGDLKTPTKALAMDSQKITGLGAPDSGDDAIRKDSVLPTLFDLNGLYWAMVLDSLDGFGQRVSGGTITLDPGSSPWWYGAIELATGATSGNYCELIKGLAKNFGGGPICTLSWTKKRRFKTRIRIDQITNQDAWVILGWPSDTTNNVGFRIINNKLYSVVTNDYTLVQDLFEIETLPDTCDRLLEVIYSPEIGVDFYVDGILRHTSVGSCLPTTENHANKLMFIRLKTTAAEDKKLHLSEFRFLQEE